VSDDGITWTAVYNTATGDGGTDNLTGSAGAGRLIFEPWPCNRMSSMTTQSPLRMARAGSRWHV
jgi:Ca2+-binding RTX toxin-like protein